MLIKFKTTAAGVDWRCNAGDSIDLPDAVADSFVDGGYATEVEEAPPEAPTAAPEAPPATMAMITDPLSLVAVPTV